MQFNKKGWKCCNTVSGVEVVECQETCFKKGERVLMRWDANEAYNEPSITSAQWLLPTKWNPKEKHTEGAWRLDIS